MNDAPKSIWAWAHTDPETGKPFGYGEWYTEDVGLDGDETEYVRFDELDRLRAENARLKEALTASADTKTAYMDRVECESSGCIGHHVPWTSIKQIMRMIRTRAALKTEGGTDDQA